MTFTRINKFLVCGVLLITATLLFLRYEKNHTSDVAADFPSFYYAARLSQDGLSPYEPSIWNRIRSVYTDGELFPFLYPPTSLPLLAVLTLWNYPTAKFVMLLANQALILGFIYVFFFKILKCRWGDWFLTPAILFLYLFDPLHVTLIQGQVNLWVLLCICLAWWGSKEEWAPIWVALPLALATALKLYPMILILIFLVRRQSQVVVYFILLLLAFLGLSAILLPQEFWQSWYANVASYGFVRELQGLMAATPANQSIHGFLTRLFYGRNVRFAALLNPLPDPWSHLAPYILCAMVTAISLLATIRISSSKLIKTGVQVDMQFSIWLLASFLIAPFSWNHHLVFILPAIFTGLFLAFRMRNWAFGISILCLSIFLAYAFPSNHPAFRQGVWTLLISSQLAAVGLLWLGYIGLALSRTKLKQPD